MFAATAPELEGRGGLYLEDCQVARVNDTPDALDGVKSYAVDVQNAERLWDVDALMPGPTDDESGSVRVICANPPQPTLT